MLSYEFKTRSDIVEDARATLRGGEASPALSAAMDRNARPSLAERQPRRRSRWPICKATGVAQADASVLPDGGSRTRQFGAAPAESSAGAHTLSVRVLGGFRVERYECPVPDFAWERRAAKQLTKLLAISPSHALHREQIISSGRVARFGPQQPRRNHYTPLAKHSSPSALLGEALCTFR